MPPPPSGVRPRISPLGAAAAIAGLALFAWALANAGLSTIADGIRRVGLGFFLLIVLAGLRFLVRAQAWAIATEGPVVLSVRDTFPALVAGDTMGNLTPLGVFLSEAVKAAFIRPRITLMAAIAGIAVENIFYILSVAIVIAGGTVALLFLFDLGETIRHLAVAALLIIALALGAGGFVIKRQVRIVTWTVDWLDRRGRLPSSLASQLAKLRTLEDLVYGFSTRHPARTALLLLLELCFHVLGVIEMWLTLGLLAGATAPTLLTTFVLESVNRMIMVAFKFVPLRLGVDEIGTELLTRTLGLPAGLGVTMAVIRKARMLVWSAVGITFLVRRGLEPTELKSGI